MPHGDFGDSDPGQAFGQAPLGYTPRWRHPMPSSPPLFSFRLCLWPGLTMASGQQQSAAACVQWVRAR